MKHILLLILSLFTFSCATNYQNYKIDSEDKIVYQEKRKTKIIAPPPAYGNKVVGNDIYNRCFKQIYINGNELVISRIDLDCNTYLFIVLSYEDKSIVSKFVYNFR